MERTTQAAIRAGYSEKTAPEQSSRLLTNVKVAAAVEKAQQKRSARTEITQDMVLLELAPAERGKFLAIGERSEADNDFQSDRRAPTLRETASGWWFSA